MKKFQVDFHTALMLVDVMPLQHDKHIQKPKMVWIMVSSQVQANCS